MEQPKINLTVSTVGIFIAAFAIVLSVAYPETEQLTVRASKAVNYFKPAKVVEPEVVDLSGEITPAKLELILKSVAAQANIVGDEWSAFMAQCAHETMGFLSLVEFGTIAYFRKYDPRHSPSMAQTLGNTKPGDGARYRGRGYIQLTGRYNYRIAGQALNLPLEAHPELAAVPHIAAHIAVWYWNHRVRPNVQDFTNVRAVTRPINPKLRGLRDRKAKFKEYQLAQL